MEYRKPEFAATDCRQHMLTVAQCLRSELVDLVLSRCRSGVRNSRFPMTSPVPGVGGLFAHPENTSDFGPTGSLSQCAPDDVESRVVQFIFEVDADRQGVEMTGRRRSQLSPFCEFPPPGSSFLVAPFGRRHGCFAHVLHTVVMNPQRREPLDSPDALLIAAFHAVSLS
ncbi:MULTISPECIES: hypothetical protein [Rhodococcus]|uniref:Uncharacterized protein n=1 Tax=Rhodococcus oxybenzonivorans TaxID=1990687 RepID=A0AAE5A997_9NOCA|nr:MULTISPECIES: hypothetical protein [Rhodococcus]MDV7242420.1 hypothetical protein [Rhodococcus oxybenzonivorans]MDV7268281.1 hypothetical protein [Rhodococcus oxybenzonivorans]MDV7277167.1 hypothetical protein [Rhodococcus oxybenzonivorans]MDV7331909.1 hypothetical protein [Rhodococcus oxybenzonivorans]MDV7344130.1 hypothetical protein [Rhodococcus oxybenzonivorans]